MLNSGWRKVFRDVTSRKMRTALVSLSIFIGVLGVVALFSMGEILIDALESAVRQDELAMLRSYVSERADQDLDDLSFVDTLAAMPGVTNIEPMVIYPVSWKHPDAPEFDKARIFGYATPLADLTIEPLELIAGRWPQAGQRELAVERRFAAAHDLAPGDPLALRVFDQGATRTETWTVTGTVFQPYQYPVLPGSPLQIPGDEMIFAHLSDVTAITAIPGISILQVRFDDYPTAEAQSSQFQTAIAAQTPYVPVISLMEDPAENWLIEQTLIFNDVLALLAVVALVVAGFLVLNVINAIVIEQRRQIGVMKALGATGWDTFAMYAAVALVYGLIGVVPGVLLGIPLGFSVSERVAPEINIYLPEFAMSTRAVVIGLALGVLVPVLAAAGPVLWGIRVTILEAITDRGIDAQYDGGILARVVDRLPLPVSLRQALRNVGQKQARLALTIITLALAAGAFMGVYATLSNLNMVVEQSMRQVGLDISISPQTTTDFELVRDLITTNVDGLAAIEPGTTLAIDVEGYTTPQLPGLGPVFLIAIGINPANPNVMNFELRSGRGWRDDPSLRGVVIAASLADNMDVGVGDELNIRAGGRTESFPVLGVSTYPFDLVWIRWQDLSRLGGLARNAPVPNRYTTTLKLDGVPTEAIGLDATAEAFLTFTAGDFFTVGEPGLMVSTALAAERGIAVGDVVTLTALEDAPLEAPVTGIFNIPPQLAGPDVSDQWVALFWEDLARLEGLSLTGAPQPNTLQVILAIDQPSVAQVDDAVDAIDTVLLDNGISASYTNWAENAEGITQMIATAGAVLNTAAALIGAVGAIGLLSILSMSVFERQKEIGVMRSVGATSGTVAFQFLVEGWIIGVVAWVLGIPFSYVLDQALVTALNFGGIPGTEYPPAALALGLVAMLILVTVASLWPAIAAARKTVSDILRYQ